MTFPGFAPFSKAVTVSAGGPCRCRPQLAVGAEKQEVSVQAEAGPSVSVEPDNNATAMVIKGEDLEALPDDPDDLSDALQALAGSGRRAERRADLYRWVHRWPASSEGIHPRDPHQPESLFGGIRPAGLRPHRDSYQAGHGRAARRGDVQRYELGARLPQSASPANKPDYSNRMFSANLGRPINKKSSFFVDFNQRNITGQLHHARRLFRPQYVEPDADQHVRRDSRRLHDGFAPPGLPAQHQQHPDGAR